MKIRKVMTVLAASAVMISVCQTIAVPASAVWVKSESGYSWRDEGSDEYVTGWKTINKKTYYFGNDGIALTGWNWVDGHRYYFISSDKGRMATGWVKMSGEKYYFGSNGVLRTGVQIIGDEMYYFDKKGRLYSDCNIMRSGKVYKINKKGIVTNRAEIEDKLMSIDKPLENIEWGMDEDEIAKAAGIDTYLMSGSQMAVKKEYDSAEQLTYFISAKKGCQCYSFSRSADVTYNTKCRARLNGEGWNKVQSANNDDVTMIVYRKDDRLALQMADNETRILYVFSDELSADFWNGDKTLYQILKTATE